MNVNAHFLPNPLPHLYQYPFLTLVKFAQGNGRREEKVERGMEVFE
jgi:hypothetical protein